MRLAAVVVVIALAGCDASECRAPEHTTYNCEPIAPGTPGCIGGPFWTVDAQTHQDDPDKVFPAGCAASIPDCNPKYDGDARTFECEVNAGAGTWVELL